MTTIDDKLNYLVENSGSGGSSKDEVYYLGVGLSFDLPKLLPSLDYTSLTVDNFILEVGSNVSASAGSNNTTSASAAFHAGTKKYDNTTGIFTITDCYLETSAFHWNGSNKVTGKTNYTPTVYIIILK